MEALGQRNKVLIATIIVFILLLVVGYYGGPGVMGNAVILGAFIIIAPQIVLSYIEYKELKEIEDRFPTFLRNLTEAVNSGMPLSQAIIFVKNNDYGKLSPYIKKMANQISWGIPLEKVLRRFQKLVSRSNKLRRAVGVMIETSKSGGDVGKTLDTLADTLSTLSDLEKERKSLMSQHVILMYFISFIFIGIVIGINKLIIPIVSNPAFQEIGMQENLFRSPCLVAQPCFHVEKTHKIFCYCKASFFSCSLCSLFNSVCSLFQVSSTENACYYVSLFFLMSLVQAIFSGLVAGVIEEGSVRAGLKHSLILSSITIGAFYILTYLGLIGV